MVSLMGKPLLFHQIDNLIKNGITSIDFLLGYNANLITGEIETYCNNLGLDFEFFVEEEPLGSGGALLSYWKLRPEAVGVVFGDIYFDLDLKTLFEPFQSQEYAWRQLTHPSSHLFDSDIIESDSSGAIIKYHLKPFTNLPSVKNRTNAGLYFFSKEAIDWVVRHQGEFPKKFDLDRDLIPRMHLEGLSSLAVEDFGYCRDIGTPERLVEVGSHIMKGVTSRKVRPMVFLDRDGVINFDSGHISSLNNFILLDGVSQAIRELNSLGAWVVVVTNQPVVARGELTIKGVNNIHSHMESVLAKMGAYVNDVFFCPHHPESGHEGEVPTLKIHCSCRKPKTGLLEMAVNKYPTDLSRSILVGDSFRDLKAAENFGVQFVGIKSDSQSKSLPVEIPMYSSLLDALDFIKDQVTS